MEDNLSKAHQIGLLAYQLGYETWSEYSTAVISTAALSGAIVVAYLSRNYIEKTLYTVRSYAYGTALYLHHRGNKMSQMRRDKFLDDIAMEAVSDRFEEMALKGEITYADKTRAYRRFGIKFRLYDLIPTRTVEAVKAGIRLRLERKVHAPVPLPSEEEQETETSQKVTMLSKLLESRKAA